MKKLLALTLACVMLLALVACGNTQPPVDDPADTTAPTTTKAPDEPAKPVVNNTPYSVLSDIWNAFPSDELLYQIVGMSYDIQNAPGKLDVTNEDDLSMITSILQYPEANTNLLKDAAGFMDAVATRNIACGAYQFEDEATTDAMVEAMVESIGNAHWVCGFPDDFMIVKVPGNILILMHGSTTTLNPYIDVINGAVSGAEILVHRSIWSEE